MSLETPCWPTFLGPEGRAACLAAARSATYADAVYLIRYFNVDANRWGPPPHEAPIEAVEVFGVKDDPSYPAMLARVKRLEQCALLMFDGDYSRAPTLDEAVAQLQGAVPGFDPRTYGRAIASAMRDMR